MSPFSLFRFIGYSSADGQLFSTTRPSQPLGLPYGEGDVIGCGVTETQRSVFFTKNGDLLKVFPIPSPPSSITLQNQLIEQYEPYDLYPEISMGSPGNCVTVNFGCEYCYWMMDGSWGIQMLNSQLRSRVERCDVKDRDKHEANTEYKHSQCVCAFLRESNRLNFRPSPPKFVFDFESIVRVSSFKEEKR